VRGRPAHAGRLRRSERCVFIGVFAVMAVLVVGVTMSMVKPSPRTAGTVAAGSQTVPAGRGSSGILAPGADPNQHKVTGYGTWGRANRGRGSHRLSAPSQGTLNARLTAALRPAASLCPGPLSVAVRDRGTGAEAQSETAGQSYPAGSTAAADILAVLLYQDQQPGVLKSSPPEQATPLREALSGTPLNGTLLRLAARMLDGGSRAATGRLWRLIGGARGFNAGAAALHLRHTVAFVSGGWQQATTSAADQLQLLGDLTSATSPLAPAARGSELALMARAAGGSRSWAAAAASPGTDFGASSGWHAGLTGSIAIVRHDGQKLIVAVLSEGCATRAYGMAVAEAAARAAAAMITTVAPARASHGQPS
jgi:hypothetical protein